MERYFFIAGIAHKGDDGLWCKYKDVELLEAKIKDMQDDIDALSGENEEIKRNGL